MDLLFLGFEPVKTLQLNMPVCVCNDQVQSKVLLLCGEHT